MKTDIKFNLVKVIFIFIVVCDHTCKWLDNHTCKWLANHKVIIHVSD